MSRSQRAGLQHPGSSRLSRKGGRVTSVETLKSTESGNLRRIAQIKFPDGSATTAYVPENVKGVEEGMPVLVRASRSRKVPGIRLRVLAVDRRGFAYPDSFADWVTPDTMDGAKAGGKKWRGDKYPDGFRDWIRASDSSDEAKAGGKGLPSLGSIKRR